MGRTDNMKTESWKDSCLIYTGEISGLLTHKTSYTLQWTPDNLKQTYEEGRMK
jgi:hypothetical protein